MLRRSHEIPERVSFLIRLSLFSKLYWKTIIAVTTLIILLPLIIVQKSQGTRCLLTTLLISIYWVTGALPLAVSSLLPILLFPILNIMNSNDVAFSFMKSASMTLLACLMITVGVMESNLHYRFGLLLVKLWGYSHRRLCFGFGITTMILAMWIPNPMVIMIMLPIIRDFLNILQKEGIAEIYDTAEEDQDQVIERQHPVPSNVAMCYYVMVAYSASIGSIATLVASPGNMAFKGLFETYFPRGPTIEFPIFMVNTIIAMIVIEILIYLFFQFFYLGMLRPKSNAAVSSEMLEHEKIALKKTVDTRYEELGPVTFHQLATGFFLLVETLYYLTRKPFYQQHGWSDKIELITQNSAPALMIVMLMFIIPRKLDFLKFFDPKSRESNLPQKSTPGLLQWKQIHDQLPWGFIYLLGAGYAICTAIKKTGATESIASFVAWTAYIPKVYTLLLILLMTKLLSEVCFNVVAINIMQPIVSEIAIVSGIHPIKAMIAASMGAALSFHFPIATPSNVILVNFAHIPTRKMAIAGIGPSIIAILVCWISLLCWTPLVMPELEEFPDWSENKMSDIFIIFSYDYPSLFF